MREELFLIGRSFYTDVSFSMQIQSSYTGKIMVILKVTIFYVYKNN